MSYFVAISMTLCPMLSTMVASSSPHRNYPQALLANLLLKNNAASTLADRPISAVMVDLLFQCLLVMLLETFTPRPEPRSGWLGVHQILPSNFSALASLGSHPCETALAMAWFGKGLGVMLWLDQARSRINLTH